MINIIYMMLVISQLISRHSVCWNSVIMKSLYYLSAVTARLNEVL